VTLQVVCREVSEGVSLLPGALFFKPLLFLFGVPITAAIDRRLDFPPARFDRGQGRACVADFDLAPQALAVINCAGEGVKTVQNDHFVALEGTRTFSVQLRDAFIADDDVLADPIDFYIPRIRAGFILLQSGMAFGLIRNCIQLMKQERTNLELINKYIEKQPEDFDASLASLEDEVWALCETPFETGQSYFRRVVEARLAAGEATVQAAHYTMLHQGAKGYLSTGAAQRRLRESYFVAIVTPAIKQLRKMLAEMPV